MESSYRAVIFDLGGVVLDSPLHAIARFERERGVPAGHVNRVVLETGPGGAWSRLERGELTVAAFAPIFEAECAAAGCPIDALAMMARIGEAAAPRPTMLTALRALRTRGLALAALTNNWESESGPVGAGDDRTGRGAGDDRPGRGARDDRPGRGAQDDGRGRGARDDLRELFDAFIESAVVGLRKPDPRIYTLACEALGVAPPEAVFLDDIGRNLKAARALGMATIKVDAPEPALAELERTLGLGPGALRA